MTALELLRFDWSRVQQRLLLAALADAGPVSRKTWALRSGVPSNHLLETAAECERLGALKSELRSEGIALFVQPVEFWRVTPLVDAAAWVRAWAGMEQCRMDLVTEAKSLAEAMAEGGKAAPPFNRNPVGVPESGKHVAGIRSDVSTYRRSNVSDPERITSKRSEDSVTGRTLQERVRTFVGERDWRRYWEHDEAQAIFEDAGRALVLASSLRYCQAALKEGVAVRKNTGAMLWEDYRRGLRNLLTRSLATRAKEARL